MRAILYLVTLASGAAYVGLFILATDYAIEGYGLHPGIAIALASLLTLVNVLNYKLLRSESHA